MKITLTEIEFGNLLKNAIQESFFNPKYKGLRDTLNFGILSKAAIRNGFTLIGYHNTYEQDIVKNGFIKRYSGIHFGSLKAAKERSKNRDMWSYYDAPTYTYKFFLKAEHPLVLNSDFDWEQLFPIDDELSLFKYLTNVLGWKDKIETYDGEGEKGERKIYAYQNIEDILKKHGYDSIIYKNDCEDKGKYSIVMFNPCNIKLAKQTYDDNGNPIPVEKRFNTNTNDTRY